MGFYESLKRFMQGRKYERLDASVRRRRRLRVAKIGGRKGKFWRLKVVPKLKLRWFDPRLLVAKLTDGYVRMMLNLADSRVFSNDIVGGGFGPCYAVSARNPFGQRHLSKCDEKIMAAIYKPFMVEDQIRAIHA